MTDCSLASLVLKNETYTLGVTLLITYKYDLKKSVRNTHLMLSADITQLGSIVQDGTTHNMHDSIPMSPTTALLLQRTPHTCIEVMVLGTNIGHVETLVHSTPMILVVGSRTHMATIVATILVIIGSYCLMHGKFGVWLKIIRTTLTLN